MGSRLEQAVYLLDRAEQVAEGSTLLHRVDARAKLAVTLCFVIVILGMEGRDLPLLVMSFAWPMIGCALGGLRYRSIFCRSLVVLPFVGLVGLFNPLLDHRPALYIGTVAVSVGWLSFMAILLRGLVAAQALFVLVSSTGFRCLCQALRQWGMPAVLVSQLLFVYRYLYVLLCESLSMERARASRGYGRRAYPLRLWGVFIGQLLLRTIDRSERIHRAMLSRGFTGTFPLYGQERDWRWRDTLFTLAGMAVSLMLWAGARYMY